MFLPVYQRVSDKRPVVVSTQWVETVEEVLLLCWAELPG